MSNIPLAAAAAAECRKRGIQATDRAAIRRVVEALATPAGADGWEDAGFKPASIARLVADVAARLAAAAPDARQARIRAAGEAALVRALAAAGVPDAVITDTADGAVRITAAGRAVRLRRLEWAALAAADALLRQQAAAIAAAIKGGAGA